ncbi:MAG: DUF3426 domain-containing protein [Burkholderiaceae bacterium]|jgi:predicted Zn finger-like uncharacterized protein
MTLATRCSHCLTLFRVSALQLQQHAGQVRCGSCGQVFSGVAGLTPGDAAAWQAGLDQDHRLPSRSIPNQLDRWTGVQQRRAAPLPWTPTARWAVGILLSFLFVQTVWWQRASVIGILPILDKPLQAAAHALGSAAAAPASSGVAIIGSNLSRTSDRQLQVELRIAHRGTVATNWPFFELTLQDTQARDLARLALSPVDYVVKPDRLNAGSMGQIGPRLLPGQEFDLTAFIDIGRLAGPPDAPEAKPTPSGFRLGLFDQLR